MSDEDILLDYFLEKVIENPEVELEDLQDHKAADNEWLEQQETEALMDTFQKLRTESKKSKKEANNHLNEGSSLPDSDFEELILDERKD